MERQISTSRLQAFSPVGRTFIGAFESTLLPAYDVDVAEMTGHSVGWRQDLDGVLAAGVRHVRYPLRWHRVEREPGVFDWSETDRILEYFQGRDAVPIVDLIHHTSYPGWLREGFRDRGFGPAYVRYAEAVARRYPWLQAYTLFNEPFATLFLAGHEALWPPYDRGLAGFVRLLRSVLPAISAAAECWAELLPGAAHVWVDTGEHHSGTGPGADYARLANDRRHVVLDLLLQHDLDSKRPFLAELLQSGGEALLELRTVRVDVLGLDYYCHSEWFYDERGAHAPSPNPVGLAEVLQQYGDRYGLPMMLTETNLRGSPSDRVSWLKYTLEQYEKAESRGIPLLGYCWFPQIDSCDWDSLLARAGGRVDPVGVLSLSPDGSRAQTLFTQAWKAAAAGAAAGDLPAYQFQSPCSEQLAGWTAALSHWNWQDAPEDQRTASATDDSTTRSGAASWVKPGIASELEDAHRNAVRAATAGVQDAALGDQRLKTALAAVIAEAAVSSATPFLRTPLLGRMSAALLLHPPSGGEDGKCPTCQVVAPCETSRLLQE